MRKPRRREERIHVTSCHSRHALPNYKKFAGHGGLTGVTGDDGLSDRPG